MLAGAVDQQHLGIVAVALQHGAAFGDHGDATQRVAGVMDDHAQQFAGVVAGADIDRQAGHHLIEDAFLQHHRGGAVAQGPLQVVEFGHRIGDQPDVQNQADDHIARGQHDGGAGQSPVAEAGRAHHHQFAVGDQLVIGEQHHGEQRHRQDHRQEVGQDQQGQFDEHRDRGATVDRDLDEAQGLRQPKNRR